MLMLPDRVACNMGPVERVVCSMGMQYLQHCSMSAIVCTVEFSSLRSLFFNTESKTSQNRPADWPFPGLDTLWPRHATRSRLQAKCEKP